MEILRPRSAKYLKRNSCRHWVSLWDIKRVKIGGNPSEVISDEGSPSGWISSLGDGETNSSQWVISRHHQSVLSRTADLWFYNLLEWLPQIQPLILDFLASTFIRSKLVAELVVLPVSGILLWQQGRDKTGAFVMTKWFCTSNLFVIAQTLGIRFRPTPP